MANDKILNGVMGGGLRALTRLADSSLVERFGLQDRTRQWVYEGARRAAEAAKRFGSKDKTSSSPASPKFDLRLSEEQQLMRDTLRRFADEVMQPAARQADDLGAPPEGFLESFSELGAIPMAIPETLGGAAERVSVVSQMLVAEDLARGDMGLAYAALSSLSFVNALVHWGSEEQQASILAALADGDGEPATVAMVEPHPLFDPQSLRTIAKVKGAELILDGQKSFVALGKRARWFLVAAEIPKAGPRLIVVPSDTPGVEVRDDTAMGLGAALLGRLVLRNARVPVDAVLGGRGALEKAGGETYQDVVNRSRIAWGAMALGTSQAMLDYVIPYCNERIAFGEPISHRQAVAFMIADIAIELESMRMLVYRAAGRIDAGLPCVREAYLARTLCAEKSMEIGTNGVQLLGGAGFIKDHPVETWYRQLRAIGVMDGNLLL